MGTWVRHAVIPSAVTPFLDDQSIDRDSLRSHIAALAVEGVTGLLVCGHAGQITALDAAERRLVLAEAVEVSPVPIAAGVLEGKAGSERQQAIDAAEVGAAALLPLPAKVPEGADPDVYEANRIAALHDATGLPIICHLVPDDTWTESKLTAIVTAPGVIGVKESSGTPATFMRNQRVIRRVNPEASIWSTHSRWLLADLAMGADGILSSMGSVVPELHVALAAAVRRGDLAEARRLNERLHPLAEFCYGLGRANLKFKHALARFGRIASAACRPPEALRNGEAEELDRLLREAALLP